jgi:hypothetical protein
MAYSTDQIMLTLAAITYRGYYLTLPEPAKRARMYQAMTDCLRKLGPVKDQWDIVWGPVSFNSVHAGFDDAAMFIARQRGKPATFAIAVRGTNPLSLFDWVFGDFMVTQQVPWSYGAAAADVKISLSTALGLRILQHLRAEPQAPDVQGSARGQPQGIRRIASALYELVTGDAQEELRRLNTALQSLGGLAQLMKPASLKESIDAMRERLSSQTVRDAREALARTLERSPRLDPLGLMMSDIELQQAFGSGIDLREFLKTEIAQSEGPVEVHVTGHSKGGGLSSTLALWLAETQGRDPVPEKDQWDPRHIATVYAYSFAGPTAGNGKFAAHSNAVIGPRCHRVVNRLDLVPHAWAVSDLEQIPNLYDLPEVEQGMLKGVVDEGIQSVKALDYQQVGNVVTELPGVLVRGKPLLLQLVHQHLDGYLQQMDLGAEMNTFTFFSPLPWTEASP